MRTIVDSDGTEWHLTQIGAVGVGTWSVPQVTHATVLATAGNRTVQLFPAVGWESMPEAKLVTMITDAATRNG